MPGHWIRRLLRRLRIWIARILYRLIFRPETITLNLSGENIVNVGQIVLATASEKDANGLNVPIVPANLQYTFDNPQVATISPNPDGTATITAIAPGTGNALVTDTKFGLTSTPVSVTVEQVVTPGQPTMLTLTLGTPQDAGSSLSPSSVSATGAQKVA